MYVPHILNLAECAEYLSSHTGEKWTAKTVLDFVFTNHRQSSERPKPVAFAALPHDTQLGIYKFTIGDKEPTRCGPARWQMAPIYHFQAAQLIIAGSTSLGLVSSPDDERGDGENYVFIEPLQDDHVITTEAVRLTKAQLMAIVTAHKHRPEINSKQPPETWKNGLKLVAWEKAIDITANENKLSAKALSEAMGKDERVTVSGTLFQYALASASLTRGEDEVDETTLKNWVTELKKMIL